VYQSSKIPYLYMVKLERQKNSKKDSLKKKKRMKTQSSSTKGRKQGKKRK
jgi:hypothetical protein